MKILSTTRRRDPELGVGSMPITVEERMAAVWELTKELASLSAKYNAEQRLQRHVVRLVPRGR